MERECCYDTDDVGNPDVLRAVLQDSNGTIDGEEFVQVIPAPSLHLDDCI